MHPFKAAKWLISSVLVLTLVLTLFPKTGHTLGDPLLKIGSRGEQVKEVQSRLAYLGYYRYKIDGQYGWRTYQAVKNFQYQFGLEQIDGIVGPKTGAMLLRATKGWRPGTESVQLGSANLFSEEDIRLMAMAVYGEARGEPYIGQVAVAAVILNRLQSEHFPNTVAGVIFEPGAFTAVSDGQFWLEPDETAYRAVYDAINGWDPTSNALFYFNPETATSSWIWSRPQIKRIGKHIFCA